MKIYDISQEVFGCAVYPGDRVPEKYEDMRMAQGEVCNLTSFSMCAHNGTHVDAPFHFLEDGITVERLPLESLVGMCYVAEQNRDLDGETAREILRRAGTYGGKILIKGTGVVTAEAACVFAEAAVELLGVEGLSVGPVDAPMEVHRILLRAGTVLLEGLRLAEVKEGFYFLSAAPLSLAGSDGAPCRAFLIQVQNC